MRMRFSTGLAVLLGAVLLAGGVQAHLPGSGPVSAEGAFVLGPAGTWEDNHHLFLWEAGLDAHSGDVLTFQWSAEGGEGPPVYFDIHEHAPSGLVVHYQATSAVYEGEWAVAGSDDTALFWQNPNPEPVRVEYDLELLPNPALAYVPLVLLAAAGVVFVYLLWRGRQRPSRTERPDGFTDETDPGPRETDSERPPR